MARNDGRSKRLRGYVSTYRSIAWAPKKRSVAPSKQVAECDQVATAPRPRCRYSSEKYRGRVDMMKQHTRWAPNTWHAATSTVPLASGAVFAGTTPVSSSMVSYVVSSSDDGAADTCVPDTEPACAQCGTERGDGGDLGCGVGALGYARGPRRHALLGSRHLCGRRTHTLRTVNEPT